MSPKSLELVTTWNVFLYGAGQQQSKQLAQHFFTTQAISRLPCFMPDDFHSMFSPLILHEQQIFMRIAAQPARLHRFKLGGQLTYGHDPR